MNPPVTSSTGKTIGGWAADSTVGQVMKNAHAGDYLQLCIPRHEVTDVGLADLSTPSGLGESGEVTENASRQSVIFISKTAGPKMGEVGKTITVSYLTVVSYPNVTPDFDTIVLGHPASVYHIPLPTTSAAPDIESPNTTTHPALGSFWFQTQGGHKLRHQNRTWVVAARRSNMMPENLFVSSAYSSRLAWLMYLCRLVHAIRK
jgi:hypothetical protein